MWTDGESTDLDHGEVTCGHVVEPYGFIYDCDDRDESQDVPLAEHGYGSYSPVLYVGLLLRK